jgi:hypothetical protein
VGISDGTVQGTTALLEPRPVTEQFNVVLLAEGFTAAEQADFDALCDEFVATLQAEPWFGVAGAPINVYRINVASDESGTDDPDDECPEGDGTLVDTYFDAGFCNGSPPLHRCLSGDEMLVRDTVDAQLPQWGLAAVLVNTTQHGGCASGNVSFTNVGSGWQNTILHEMGHSLGLADEYDYWSGCGDDNPRVGESANTTRTTVESMLKWRHLLTPGVPIPTHLNPDCGDCNNGPNPLGDDHAVGLYEGAQYEACSMFRPSYVCRMRSSANDFCRVCLEHIVAELGGYADATPTLEVIPGSLDFGEVAEDLTLHLAVEVRNVRDGHPMPMDVELSAPTGGFTYASGTETSFTLPAPVYEPYTSRLVFVAFTASSAGVSNGSMSVVTTGDTAGQSEEVTLTGTGVPPVPVDTVLVIDRSGSMDDETGDFGHTKIDHAIEAAELYVSLLREGDQIGIVRYNDASDPSDVLLAMRTAGALGSGAGRLAASAALTPANLEPDGGTTIGGGIINGSGVLSTATADARALVVLTDGRQNTAPDVPAAEAVVTAASPEQRVFAVGLGLNQLEDTLQQIASVTDGVAQITGDLVDEREFLLRKLYVQILSDVANEAFVRDPIEVLRPGQCRGTSVWLSEIDVGADFIVTWRPNSLMPKYLRMWLEMPDGTTIDATDPSPAVDHVAAETHAFFRVRFPYDPSDPLGHAGRWRVWVEYPRTSSEFAADLRYTVMATARSNLLLGGRVVQADHAPGSAMQVALEPTLFGRPVALDGPVVVTVTRPDGATRTVTTAPDEFGVYRGTYTDTPLVGPYAFATEVWASSPSGHRVTRHRHMTGLVFIRGAGGAGSDGTGSDGHCHWHGCTAGKPDEDCAHAERALHELAAFVMRCCREQDVGTRLPDTARRIER